MPQATDEIIYVGASFWWRIPAVNIDDALMTSTNPPDSFAYDVLLNGSSVATGSMIHSSKSGTWEAKINGLGTAGTYHLHATAVKGSGIGKFHDQVTITAFT